MGPRNIVEDLNRKMAEKFEGEGVFLTLMAAMFNQRKSEMIYTIAGHEPPFLIKDDGTVESLLKTQLVVGIDPEFVYRQTSVPFEPGSMLCVFSDGIIEARSEDGEMFDRDRMKTLLKKNAGLPSKQIIGNILSELREFTKGMEMHDELSIVLVASKGE
jgi:sigma-B regulation protein RsbU (phosphoserine phosphatase)